MTNAGLRLSWLYCEENIGGFLLLCPRFYFSKLLCRNGSALKPYYVHFADGVFIASQCEKSVVDYKERNNM